MAVDSTSLAGVTVGAGDGRIVRRATVTTEALADGAGVGIGWVGAGAWMVASAAVVVWRPATIVA